MINPLVSVIIPIYNAENTIEQCMESVLAQTYSNLEVILLNDGSIDDSLNIVESFVKRNRLEWSVINKNNEGVSRTRNIGIQKAKGEYIAFLDADDGWHEKKIQKQIDYVNITRAKVVGTLKGETYIESGQPCSKVYNFSKMLISNRIATSSFLGEKSLLKVGFNEKMNYAEDYNLWMDIAYFEDIHIIQEVLVKYRISSLQKGASSKLWEMEKNELSVYKRLFYENKINVLKYTIVSSISFLKYLRRKIFYKY